MRLEIDHVFVAVRPGAPEAEVLREFGLTAGTRATHPGQGTSNARFFFENAYLELLWIHDGEEVRSADVRRTGLWQRCRWRETRACPFGIAFRMCGEPGVPPFPTWAHRPAFLPPGSSIDIAIDSANLAEPLLFVVPGGQRPTQYGEERRQPLAHQCQVREITAVAVTLPGDGAFSPALRTVGDQGLVQCAPGEEYHLELEFDGASSGRSQFFGPAMPLSVRW